MTTAIAPTDSSPAAPGRRAEALAVVLATVIVVLLTVQVVSVQVGCGDAVAVYVFPASMVTLVLAGAVFAQSLRAGRTEPARVPACRGAVPPGR